MTTRAMVGSARSYVFDVVGDFWSTLEAGGGASHAYRACHEAVQLLADTVGSSSVYRSSPLERPLRDLTTLPSTSSPN